MLIDRVDGEMGAAVARAARSRDADVIAFFREACGAAVPYAALGVADAFGYGGVAVATDLLAAATLLGVPGPTRRFFYVHRAEWASGPMAYEQMAAIYGHPTLSLVAPGDAERHAVESTWNVRVAATIPPSRFEDLISHILEVTRG